MISVPIRPHIRSPISHPIRNPSGGAAAVLWDPSDGDFTLGGWWDPAIEDWKTKEAQEFMTINTSTDPDQITLLEDRSGVGIDLASLGESFEPKVGLINSLRATDFVPTDLYRTASVDVLTFFGATSSSIAFVIHQDADVGAQFFTVANMNVLLGFGDATLYLRLPGNTSTAFPVGWLNNDHIYFGGRNDANTQVQRVDGTEIQSGAGSGSIAGTDVLDIANAWNGQMGDLIVTTTEVSTDDHEKLEGFLAWKWGLEGNLPADHTYKAAAPNV